MYKNFGTNCSFSFLRKHNLLSSLLLCLNHESALMMTFSKWSRGLLTVTFCLDLFWGFVFVFLVSFPSALLSVRRPRSSQLRQPLDSVERPALVSVGAGAGPAVAAAPGDRRGLQRRSVPAPSFLSTFSCVRGCLPVAIALDRVRDRFLMDVGWHAGEPEFHCLMPHSLAYKRFLP